MCGQHHALAASPPGRRNGTNCIGGWAVPRVSLDGCRKSQQRNSILAPSSPWKVAVRTAQSRPNWTRHGSVIQIYDCWSLIGKLPSECYFCMLNPPPKSIVHMRTFTLPSHPNTHAHNTFLLHTCACCKLQCWRCHMKRWRKQFETGQYRVTCDPRFQLFCSSLKRRL